MLVRTRQHTQEQGEDAPETTLPLASSLSPVGRGFLGLTLVGFGFFFSFYLQPLLLPTPSPPCFQMPARDGLFLDGRSGMVPLASAWSHLWTRAFVVTFPTAVTRGVTCLAAPLGRARVAAGAGRTLISSDSPRRQLPAQSLPGRHFFCGQSSAVGVTDTEAIN